jgi:gluconolactonase
MATLTDTLELLATTDAHEGPVYAADEDALYFTALPRGGRSAIKRLDLATRASAELVADANAANGMAMDREGRLVVCEQGSLERPARITRRDRSTGAAETLVEDWHGRRLNSPNDVVVASDGAIWFTDPSYGHLQGFRPEPEVGDFVYRLDPERGDLTVVADGFDKPNGLAFSPDEDVLYVTDSGANQEPGSFHPGRPHHVKAFDVAGGRRLAGERLFAVTAPGFPDGIKVDDRGRVYVSAVSGVLVYSPEGDRLGEIPIPGAVNFTFGGDGRLLITTDTAVWSADPSPRGA